MERYFLKIGSGLPVASLLEQLEANPGLWGAHPNRLYPGSPHSECTDIWVRFRPLDELTEPRHFAEPHVAVWRPCSHLLPAAVAIAEILEQDTRLRAERLGLVLLTKLPPGAKIARHIDYGWHAREYEKFYVAVKNKPGSVFAWPLGEVRAQEGEVWWFRNDVPHWVNNDSAEDRISLIVCIKTSAFDYCYDERRAA
jgi:hypothetical protein